MTHSTHPENLPQYDELNVLQSSGSIYVSPLYQSYRPARFSIFPNDGDKNLSNYKPLDQNVFFLNTRNHSQTGVHFSPTQT
jgi:hypothetical protein